MSLVSLMLSDKEFQAAGAAWLEEHSPSICQSRRCWWTSDGSTAGFSDWLHRVSQVLWCTSSVDLVHECTQLVRLTDTCCYGCVSVLDAESRGWNSTRRGLHWLRRAVCHDLSMPRHEGQPGVDLWTGSYSTENIISSWSLVTNYISLFSIYANIVQVAVLVDVSSTLYVVSHIFC